LGSARHDSCKRKGLEKTKQNNKQELNKNKLKLKAYGEMKNKYKWTNITNI
jgi:hypothetical protein